MYSRLPGFPKTYRVSAAIQYNETIFRNILQNIIRNISLTIVKGSCRSDDPTFRQLRTYCIIPFVTEIILKRTPYSVDFNLWGFVFCWPFSIPMPPTQMMPVALHLLDEQNLLAIGIDAVVHADVGEGVGVREVAACEVLTKSFDGINIKFGQYFVTNSLG